MPRNFPGPGAPLGGKEGSDLSPVLQGFRGLTITAIRLRFFRLFFPLVFSACFGMKASVKIVRSGLYCSSMTGSLQPWESHTA